MLLDLVCVRNSFELTYSPLPFSFSLWDIVTLGGLQVGGGINLENAISYLEKGANHVIVTSVYGLCNFDIIIIIFSYTLSVVSLFLVFETVKLNPLDCVNLGLIEMVPHQIIFLSCGLITLKEKKNLVCVSISICCVTYIMIKIQQIWKNGSWHPDS